MRKTKLLPAVAVRRVTRDVKLGDYFLPKGTKLNYVPATVHNDERVGRNLETPYKSNQFNSKSTFPNFSSFLIISNLSLNALSTKTEDTRR